jgi:hypothetical protein
MWWRVSAVDDEYVNGTPRQCCDIAPSLGPEELSWRSLLIERALDPLPSLVIPLKCPPDLGVPLHKTGGHTIPHVTHVPGLYARLLATPHVLPL